MYETAVKNNVDSFIFENEEFNVKTAKHICTLGDRAEKEYEKYIDDYCENEYYENFKI